MTKNLKPFGVQINDKGGRHFRTYTRATLQMLFDTSPSAANFETMIVVEGLVFMALRSYYLIRGEFSEYSKFIKNDGSFFSVIERIYLFGIIDEKLKKKLHRYRKLRNEIAHDLFQLKSIFTEKTPKFKDYPHSKSLRDLFKLGLEIFNELGEIVTPGQPTQEEYTKRFSGSYQRTIV